MVIGEGIGLLRLLLELIYGADKSGMGILSVLVSINFLHFSIFLFLVSTFIILVISYAPRGEKKSKVSSVQYLVPNSFSELAVSFSRNRVNGYLRINILISAFILLVIIGLWSMWF